MLVLRCGQRIKRNDLLEKLVSMQFLRNNIEFGRGTFRVKGDNVDIIPIAEKDQGIRITFFDDETAIIKGAMKASDYWNNFQTNLKKNTFFVGKIISIFTFFLIFFYIPINLYHNRNIYPYK